jgi:hypothetical protein
MSYHVTILRTHGGKQLPIGREEVVAAVESRPDLQASPGDDGTLDVTVKARGEESPVLVWQDGEVWTRNPDADTLRLMIELAEALGARVRGDELETYRSPTESYVHPDDAAAVWVAKADVSKLIARHRVMRFIPLVLFFALALLYGYCSRPRPH